MSKVVLMHGQKFFWFGLLLLVMWVSVLVTQNPSVKIGVLHSQTGFMAVSERPVINATLMAIDEINAKGGVLNRPIEAIVLDGASEPQRFAYQAESLIQQYAVSALFGCWTTSSRQAVRPVIEQNHHALFYPVQYEGNESSPNIIYSAEVPNQQVIPALSWINQYLGKRLVLVGSDYLYPRAVNKLIRAQAQLLDMTVLAEVYYPLDYNESPDINALLALKPDVIVNTLNGQVNAKFFSALNEKQSVDLESFVPVMSFSLSDTETQYYWQEQGISFAGHYSSWGYHPSIDLPENKAFISRYQARYGADATVNSPMVNAYNNVYLWKMAVERAQSFEPEIMLKQVAKVGYFGPAGKVFVDSQNHHTWKSDFIAQYDQRGHSAVVWQSGLIQPKPYYKLMKAPGDNRGQNE
ncbi:urea ABC transporter substrate-binding protein [Hydrogenovibrio sp. SC-1]|uniref:urea ABC transporter substrate-binding protein n=1 Tax=Hydrogenovibrio sp. SC-1 TaxID=2065820 RepID=UPI000C7B979B|nr:urea ABC transporter substrate-binding protein [Hydrogenovibrio sp. SC-1]PLA74560.1 urea ABC transporter substrate-binding protein [Hydrogenovibrio sp. SC-1]